jgi:hypothetical protein
MGIKIHIMHGVIHEFIPAYIYHEYLRRGWVSRGNTAAAQKEGCT